MDNTTWDYFVTTVDEISKYQKNLNQYSKFLELNFNEYI